MKNPAQELLRTLLKDTSGVKAATIKRAFSAPPSELISTGGQSSEVANLLLNKDLDEVDDIIEPYNK